MGKLTHTVKGPIASFRSADIANIESLKLHFLPKQEGSGDPSPTNIRPITGWNNCKLYKAKKNLVHVVGYSAASVATPTSSRAYTNGYGTTINTLDYTLPDSSVVITQDNYSNSTNKSDYRNGYIFVVVDNLNFEEKYDISFKVSNITNNPLNVGLGSLVILVPSGSAVYGPKVVGDTVIFKNVTFSQLQNKPNMKGFDIRICGLSCTISEFMITPAKTSDGVFVPYEGSIIPITFPIVGKNKFNPSTMINYDNHWSISNGVYSNNYTDTREAIQLTVQLWKTSGSYLKTLYVDYLTSIGRHTLTFTVDDPAGHFICLKHNGKKKDFILLAPWAYGCNTYTFSVDVLSNDPTTVGGVQLTNIQLEVGDTATAYEPYSSGNTLLGGYIDPVKGEIWKEYDEIVFDGSDADVFTYVNTTDSSGISRHYFNTKVLDRIVKSNSTSIAYSDSATPTSNNFDHRTTICYYIGTPTNQVSLNIAATECDPTAESFNSYLQNHPVHLVYKFATPVLVATFNPTNLQTFLDYNNFWSDTNDDTEVEYTFTDHLSKRKLIMNIPHIESTSGSVASFNTDIKAPIVDLKAHFIPVQEGTGDPSPNNIRPINGHTGLNINETGKNLINLSTASKQNNSSNIETTIVDNTITVTAKKSNGPGVLLQQTIYWDIPQALRGKEVYFGVGSVNLTTNNENHKATIVCEFKDEDNKFITDPTVVAWTNGSSSNTIVRKYTIPQNAAILKIYFRIAQNASTYGIVAGDTVIYNDFYIRYPTEPYGNYEKYDGEMISIEFPATKNLLNPTTNPIWNNGNYTINSDGSVTVAGSDGRGWTSNQITPFILPKGTYTFSWTGSQRVQFTTSNDSYETVTTYNYSTSNGHFTFTLANDGGIKWKHTGDAALYPTTCFVQIEKGSSATAFEPYGTVYGGYVDLIHGKLIAEYEIINKPLNQWTRSPSTSIRCYTDFKNPIYGPSDSYSYVTYQKCNIAPFSWSDTEMTSPHFYADTISSGGGRAYIYLPVDFDSNQVIQVIAKLKTPIKYDFTPEILKSLIGQNNIWADANGNVDVKYWTH